MNNSLLNYINCKALCKLSQSMHVLTPRLWASCESTGTVLKPVLKSVEELTDEHCRFLSRRLKGYKITLIHKMTTVVSLRVEDLYEPNTFILDIHTTGRMTINRQMINFDMVSFIDELCKLGFDMHGLLITGEAINDTKIEQ